MEAVTPEVQGLKWGEIIFQKLAGYLKGYVCNIGIIVETEVRLTKEQRK